MLLKNSIIVRIKKLELGDTLLLRHKSIKTTMIYTHVLREINKKDVKSPLDF